MTSQTQTLTKTDLEEICRANIVGAKVNGPYISVPFPQSERKAERLAYFWHPVFKEHDDKIKNINFFYQEKDKELPQSSLNNFLKKLGFNIKSKIEEGKIGEYSIAPELIRYGTGKIANVITNKENWTQANKIAQNSKTFSAPFVMMPKNLCYQINIPLECVKSVEFKGDFY